MTDRRTLGLLVVGLVLAAVGFWGASRLVWYRGAAEVPLRGPVEIGVTGAQTLPALSGLSLLALAAVAALVALGGVGRRVFGGLIALAGAGAVAAAGFAGLAPPHSGAELAVVPGELGAGADIPEVLAATTISATAAPWLAVAAGLLLVAVGALVALRERRLPRLGARFAAPGDQRAPAGRAVPVDPDRAAWDALDQGRDPTDAGR